MQIGSCISKKGEVRSGFLKVSFKGKSAKIPIKIIEGDSTKKVCFVSAGMHGDELNGVNIVSKYAAKINPKSLHGTLILVPILNPIGFHYGERRIRYDNKDLNRCFNKPVDSISSKLAKTFFEEVVAVSDSKGAIHNPKGLDITNVLKFKAQNKTVTGYKPADNITLEELVSIDCDVLIPAATEGQINSKNANSIKARIIAEGANDPTTREADAILNDKGVFVLPDILANAGGVVVSYFEWVQNRKNEHWDEATVKQRLQEKMVRAFRQIWKEYETSDYDMRTVAHILAVKKIVKALRF